VDFARLIVIAERAFVERAFAERAQSSGQLLPVNCG
jgi:hypothetical protein